MPTSSIASLIANEMAADHDDAGKVVLVDERDARLRAAVAGDEAHETGDEQRVRDQHAEQERRPDQDAQVLPQDQAGATHVNTSSACSSR